MLYLYIDNNQIKLLAAKKSLFSQYSIGSFEKKFQVDLIKNGKVANIDVLASAVKEVLQNTPAVKDKQVQLILPQDTFKFLRVEVPSDIAPSAIESFIKDKITTSFPQNTSDLYYDYFIIENGPQKVLSLFTVETETVAKYQEMLKLLDLELQNLMPETLAYFKLFEKTLRRGKIENILYGKYEKGLLYTYLYDSFGLLEEGKDEHKISSNGKSVENLLKHRGTELEKKGRKINRLILSGESSDTVRQDTFTKEVGMWTNPLKRIIPQFYQEYVKMLVTEGNTAFSILDYDMCLGAFIFSIENKMFSPLKRKFVTNIFTGKTAKQSLSFKAPSLSFRIPKEALLFAVSFALSFGLFSLLNKSGIRFALPKLPSAQKQAAATPTPPPPTATPTPAFTRADLKIRILNGSGTPGKASEVRDILEENDYQEIVTGNADTFDYTVTEIQVKDSRKTAAAYITEDLADYVKSPKVTTLDEDETADVTIIVGTDFE